MRSCSCSGLAQIGSRFNQDRMDGLALTIRHGRPSLFYPAAPVSHHGAWSDQDPRAALRTRGLTLVMEEPLRRWRIRLEGRTRMDLRFDATSPPFDYRAEGRRIAADMTGAHFEQCGRVTGWLDCKGERVEIDAAGQRDKSWGVRDWRNLTGWNWITAHFDDGVGFNATLGHGALRQEPPRRVA
jgi:hypothetical protein